MNNFYLSIKVLHSWKKKITLIGAGQIGGTLAHLIAIKELADVVLFDVAEGTAKGKALDIAQSSPVDGFNINLSGTSNYDDTKNSDVIIITAGVPRKPGMTRDDLLGINLKIIKQVADGIKKTSPNAFVICITNPLDVIVMALQKYSGLPKNKVVGMAGILDSSRFIYFLSQELKIPVNKIKSLVLGGHGDSMVAMVDQTEIEGIKLNELVKEGKIKKERLEEIIERTKAHGNYFLTLLSNIFTNLNLSDMECCYKVFKSDIINNIDLRENRFGFEPEVTAKIAHRNLKIFEVGVKYYGRKYADGKKITWKDGFSAIRCIIKYNLLQILKCTTLEPK